MKRVVLGTVCGVVLAGCAMFSSWRSIPPPGGCDRCHTGAISNDWRVTLTAAQLSTEGGKPHWQQEGALLPPPSESPLEQRMLSDASCFRCHREPNLQHRNFRGSYHHR